MDQKTTAINAAASIRETIESAIAWGLRLPGDRLDEQQLALEFGVSRTPVREALQHLAAAGLVEIRPRRGAVVAMPSAERLYEMFEVMSELEALCGRLAARRITSEGLAALQQANAACAEETGDADRYYSANERFHQQIYRLSGNGFLAEEALSLQKRLTPFRRLQLRVSGRIASSFAEHERIVAFIGRGDGEATAAELRAHVRVQGERFSDLIASLSRLRAA